MCSGSEQKKQKSRGNAEDVSCWTWHQGETKHFVRARCQVLSIYTERRVLGRNHTGFVPGRGSSFFLVGKKSHNDSLGLKRVGNGRSVLQGRAGVSGHWAWGAILRAGWSNDPGRWGAAGPSRGRSLIGWPCRTREAPLRFFWRHLRWVYLERTIIGHTSAFLSHICSRDS